MYLFGAVIFFLYFRFVLYCFSLYLTMFFYISHALAITKFHFHMLIYLNNAYKLSLNLLLCVHIMWTICHCLCFVVFNFQIDTFGLSSFVFIWFFLRSLAINRFILFIESVNIFWIAKAEQIAKLNMNVLQNKEWNSSCASDFNTFRMCKSNTPGQKKKRRKIKDGKGFACIHKLTCEFCRNVFFFLSLGRRKLLPRLVVGNPLIMAISGAISPIIDSKCLHFGA